MKSTHSVRLDPKSDFLPLWTVKDVARYLNIHELTVYKRVKNGDLPFVRIGEREIRFKKEEIDTWIKDQSYVPKKLINKDLILAYGALNDGIVYSGGFGEMAKAKTKSRYKLGYGAIYQRKTKEGNVRWYLDYRDGAGKRVQKLAMNAMTADDARIALQQAVQWAFDREHSIVREKARISFKEFAEVYSDNYAKIKKRSWERSDKHYLKAQLVPQFGQLALSEIEPLCIERFIAKRLKDGVQKSSINRELACLRMMLNKAIEWGYLSSNPMCKVKLFSEKDNQKERILTRDEEARLFAACSAHLSPVLLVALNTGMRRGEILNLRWKHIDFEARQIRVENTKSGRTRHIGINSSLSEVFKQLKGVQGPDSYVFVNPETGTKYTDLKTAFKGACIRAKIVGLRFHDLRHTFATRLVQNGVDLITVKQLLGHSTVTVTERYTHSCLAQKVQAVESLVEKNALNRADLLHSCDTVSASVEDLPPSSLGSVN